MEQLPPPIVEDMQAPLLGEPPSTRAAYFRLGILGASFFLAVYLGLEAASLFAAFPVRLPVSNLMITYGGLSNDTAAYTLIGLLVTEVIGVQVWAWRTRKLSNALLGEEELSFETSQMQENAPVVTQEKVTSQMPEIAGPTPPMPEPAVSEPMVDPAPVAESPSMGSVPDGTMQAEPIQVMESQAIEDPKQAGVPTPDPVIERFESPPERPLELEMSRREDQTSMVSQMQSEQRAAEKEPEPPSRRPEPAIIKQAPRPVQAQLPASSRPTEGFLTTYQIYPENPDVWVGIQRDLETGGFRYIVNEPKLNATEKQVYANLTRLLVDELEVDMTKLKNNKQAQAYLVKEAKSVANKYNLKIPPDSYRKIAYYFNRDYIKLGKIEVMMNDPRIEDISCDGPKVPLFIWHRDYESIPTNVVFADEKDLDTFASKLAYVSGKHISIASPIVDATLPDGSRVQITYGREVSKRGGNFTIRKFKADPITIVDLLKYNTVSPELGAYLWYLIERRMSILVAGGTASGKSIPYDEKVLVYQSGAPQLVSIGQLYDTAASSSKSRVEDGYEILDANGLETAAFDQNLKVARFPVSSIIRHPSEKGIFRILTRSGREVRTTGDHSVFTVIDGAVLPYPTSSLTPGMFVGVPRSIPAPDSNNAAIDLIDLFALRDHGLYIQNIARYASLAIDRIGLEKTADTLRMRRRSVREGVANGFLAARVGRFAALLALVGPNPEVCGPLEIRPKTNASQKVPARMPVTKSLMRLLGYWTAEGMYQRGVTLFQLDPRIRDDMRRVVREVFGVELHDGKRDRTRLDLNSTAAKALMKELFQAEGGSANKRIPGVVLEQGNDLLSEFLKAYFTGDGLAGNYVEASTKSRELSKQLLHALSRFGIVAVTKPKNVKGKTYHRILIYGQKNVARFAETIGFLNKYQQRVVEMAGEAKAPHTNVDTIPGAGNLLKRALAFKSGPERKEIWSNWHTYWSGGSSKSIGSQAIVKLVAETSAQGEVKEALLALAYSDIFWDEVVEVEEVAYDREYVYDLEVPGAQNFVGGEGGVFLHNTTTLNALSMFIPPDQKIVSVEDSVTGDAEILVSERGHVRKALIGPYIDEALQAGAASTPMGHELARPDGVDVLTADASGRVFWSRCTALIRHKVCKDFVKVRTRTGRTIEVTADHSLFSLGERGELSNIAGRDVSIGTFLVVPRSIPTTTSKIEFDLSALPEFAGYALRAGAPHAAAGQQLRVQAMHSALSIPARIGLDADLSFLAGLWMADGFYGERTVGFSAGAKDIETRIRDTARSLGVNVTRHSDGISFLINSKPLKTFFEKTLRLTGDDYSRHVPDVFFDAPDDVVASFLRGYFTGDGNVSASEVYVESASMQLLKDIQTLLLRFGIILSVGFRRKVGSLGGMGTFRAGIVGAAQVAAFARKVGFEQSNQMKKLFARPKASKYHLDPIPLSDLLIEELRQAKAGGLADALRQRVNMGMRRRVISRKTLLDLAEVRPSFRGTRAYSLATSGFYFDRVLSVERSNREENVYDLSVPETGKFIANNILCHNTPELNLSHKNWIQSISRMGGVAGEITLFDLLKNALRQRPDIIIVGEVRGVEAFTLFQAIASVTGDTPVLVREGDRVELKQIGDFVDRFYQGNSERVPMHVAGCEVLSFAKAGTVRFSPVKYVLRHKAKEVFALRYAGGRVRATGSHSVFVFNERGEIVARPVSSLSTADMLVSFCGSELERHQQVVEVEPILRRVEGHRTITERKRALCPHCQSSRTIKKGSKGGQQRFWCKECEKIFKDDPEPGFEDELQTRSGEALVSFERSLAIPRQITVDEEFAKVMGIYMADGCVKTHKGSSRVVFSLGAKEKALFAEDAIRFFARYGSHPSVDDRETYAQFEFNHTPLAEVFRELCGGKLDEKRIPDFMWTAAPTVVDAFLAGWEADGRRTIADRSDMCISSVRKDLVEALSWLARLNSHTSYISERGGPYPSVYISRLGESRRSDAIPADLLRRLKALMGSSAWVHMPKRGNKTVSKSRGERALQEILSKASVPMSWDAANLVSTITSLLDGSLIASRVLGIEKISFEGFVYDVSVPGTEAFFGGDSPVALHNTGHGGLGTVHADSVQAAINRLTTEPMNVPKSLLGSTLDCIVMQLRIKLKDKSVRRMVNVAEIVGHESSSDQIVLNNAFKWDPVSDNYEFSGRSRLFEKITKRFGTTQEQIRSDIEDRRVFLSWVMKKNIRDYRELSQQIREFYSDPHKSIDRAVRELESRSR